MAAFPTRLLITGYGLAGATAALAAATMLEAGQGALAAGLGFWLVFSVGGALMVLAITAIHPLARAFPPRATPCEPVLIARPAASASAAPAMLMGR